MFLLGVLLGSMGASANSRERLEIMRTAFENAGLPHFTAIQLDKVWLCSEVSNRKVKNPFQAVFRRTGLAYTIVLSEERSIVMVPAPDKQCYIGSFGDDINYSRMDENGYLISEIVSVEDSGSGLSSSIDPSLSIKGYVTCSQL
jgi:hypothetical protein